MQFALEYLPLILFLVAYKIKGIYVATAVAMAASVIAILFAKFTKRPISVMQWLSLAIIVIFGGATIWLQDETFIKIKPSVLYGLFAVILLGGKLFFKKDLLQNVMGQAAGLDFSPAVWTRLTWAWSAFFVVMALLNLYVAFNYPLDTWVNFKVWGTLVLSLIFVAVVGVYLMRAMPESDNSKVS